MSALVVLIAVAISVPATIVASLLALAVIWTKFPRMRVRIQRAFLVQEPKIRDLDSRVFRIEKGQIKQGRKFEKEVEAGRKAERAMTDMLHGLATSALRTNDRLTRLERKGE